LEAIVSVRIGSVCITVSVSPCARCRARSFGPQCQYADLERLAISEVGGLIGRGALMAAGDIIGRGALMGRGAPIGRGALMGRGAPIGRGALMGRGPLKGARGDTNLGGLKKDT
jgi:hypothetical protein